MGVVPCFHPIKRRTYTLKRWSTLSHRRIDNGLWSRLWDWPQSSECVRILVLRSSTTLSTGKRTLSGSIIGNFIWCWRKRFHHHDWSSFSKTLLNHLEWGLPEYFTGTTSQIAAPQIWYCPPLSRPLAGRLPWQPLGLSFVDCFIVHSQEHVNYHESLSRGFQPMPCAQPVALTPNYYSWRHYGVVYLK